MPLEKTLIHVCCAPCLLGTLTALRRESLFLQGFFYNPNIHPFLEFRKRVKAVRVFSERDPLPIEIDENYGLELFVRQAYAAEKSIRCGRCFAIRLNRTAQRAAEKGFDSFTTTLLSSPHQDHEMIRLIGERAAVTAGVKFLYRDLRPEHEAGHEEAKRRFLYSQQYCGCCFSEFERYRDTTRELYRGGSAE